MSLTCPRCRFTRGVEPGVRLELCPRCSTEGHDVYLEQDGEVAAPPTPRRHDLIGLLATARAELARARRRLDDGRRA